MSKITLSHKNSCLVEEEYFAQESKRLEPYLARLREIVFSNNYLEKEASINLVNDDSVCDKVLKLVSEVSNPRLKYIFLIGIGGSNLGAMAIYNALGFDKDVHKAKKIIFLDTNNVLLIKNTIEIVKNNIFFPEEFVLNVVSKSGGTTETIVNFEIIYKALFEQLKGDEEELSKRVIITTDEGSKLWQMAEEKNFKKIAVEKQVGGRYSIFSPVGLLPLALCGVDVKEFKNGGKEMLNECLFENSDANPALISAISLYFHAIHKRNIVSSFIFNAELESFGKWYSQLIAESIGKEFDRDQKKVNVGITPIISIGSTDLHSVAQLYLGGPADKFTFFIHSLLEKAVEVPQKLLTGNINGIIKGKDTNLIMKAILEGAEEAYKNRRIPFIDTKLDDISPRSLGALVQLKMLEVIILAELYNVDAFDQPNVEAYKIETKKILEQKK